MDDQTKLCGDVIGEPCAFEVECQLAAGHDGEHYVEVRWPRYERQPPGPPTAMSRALEAVWGSMIERHLTLTPVFGASSVQPHDD